MTNSYNIQDNEKVLGIVIWLGREVLQFVQTLNDEEQEKFKTSIGLLEVLNKRFKPQYSETILSLQMNERAKWNL